MPNPGDIIFLETILLTIAPVQRVVCSMTVRVLRNSPALGLTDWFVQAGCVIGFWRGGQSLPRFPSTSVERGATFPTTVTNITTGLETVAEDTPIFPLGVNDQGNRSALQLTMPLTLRTGRRGRSYMGRILAPPPRQSNFFDNQSLLLPEIYQNLLANCQGFGYFGDDEHRAELVVWGRKLSGSTPAVFPVTSITPHRELGVSRRRGYFN